jgi:hypothetical protein
MIAKIKPLKINLKDQLSCNVSLPETGKTGKKKWAAKLGPQSNCLVKIRRGRFL